MMNIYNKNKDKISYSLLRLVTKISEMECKVRNYGTDVPLYEAEIHMIKAIKESEGIHVTGLAEQLGVTKGAVSQIIAKIDKKGMIVKDKDASNQSRLVLRLSEKGETAYQYHGKLHGAFEELVAVVLSESTEEEKAFLLRFISALEKKVDDFEDNRNE